MADIHPTPMKLLKGFSPPPAQESGERLWRWVSLSGALHGSFIVLLFLMPHAQQRRAPSYPVYSVELVGGERLGGANLGTALGPPAQAKKAPEKAKSEPQPQVKVAKREKVKPEKVKPAEKSSQMQETATLAKPKKEAKKGTKEEVETERGLPGELREKLIQSALERVRERAQSGQKKQSGEGITSGPAAGEGAAAIGAGGRGGGIVKGVEFIVYYNQMRRLIRERWTWVGKRSDLEVKVRFGIRENGEIVGLKIIRGSGDPSYDDSVYRAVRGASPLPPPPESYRRDFMDVELTFRPKDLGG